MGTGEGEGETDHFDGAARHLPPFLLTQLKGAVDVRLPLVRPQDEESEGRRGDQ